jgi:hypothetical protein
MPLLQPEGLQHLRGEGGVVAHDGVPVPFEALQLLPVALEGH